EQWTTTFPPIWKPTELEREQVRSTRTATDIAMISAGLITVEQVAEQRLVQGSTAELRLDAVSPSPAPEPEPAPEPVADAPGVDGDLVRLLVEMATSVRAGTPPEQAAWALQRAGLDDDLEQLLAML